MGGWAGALGSHGCSAGCNGQDGKVCLCMGSGGCGVEGVNLVEWGWDLGQESEDGRIGVVIGRDGGVCGCGNSRLVMHRVAGSDGGWDKGVVVGLGGMYGENG